MLNTNAPASQLFVLLHVPVPTAADRITGCKPGCHRYQTPGACIPRPHPPRLHIVPDHHVIGAGAQVPLLTVQRNVALVACRQTRYRGGRVRGVGDGDARRVLLPRSTGRAHYRTVGRHREGRIVALENVPPQPPPWGCYRS